MPGWRAPAARLIFGLGAAPYDWITGQPTWRDHCGTLADLFPPARGDRPTRILDLGIGPGVSGLAIVARRPDARVTGVDLSGPMLRRAAREARRRDAALDLARADAARLPFGDGVFDVATQHSFLYLVDDRGAVLDEVRRVLAPGGTYVMLEPHRRARPWRIPGMRGELRFKISMAAWRVVAAGFGQFDRDELRALLERHGFGEVCVDETLGGLGLLATARRGDPSRPHPGR